MQTSTGAFKKIHSFYWGTKLSRKSRGLTSREFTLWTLQTPFRKREQIRIAHTGAIDEVHKSSGAANLMDIGKSSCSKTTILF